MSPSPSPRVIDVRGLPPPEPLVRVLEATMTLAPGESLVMVHDRNPVLLYPRLAERGLGYVIAEGEDGLIRVTITRPA